MKEVLFFNFHFVAPDFRHSNEREKDDEAKRTRYSVLYILQEQSATIYRRKVYTSISMFGPIGSHLLGERYEIRTSHLFILKNIDGSTMLQEVFKVLFNQIKPN